MKKKLNIFKLIALCVLGIMLVMPVCAQPAEAAKNAYIYRLVGDRVRLRTAPTSSYDNVITSLARGTRMIRIGNQGNWFKVRTQNGKVGWIFSNPYLSYYGAASQKSMAVTTQGTRLLKSASKKASTKLKLPYGTPLIVRRYNSTWAQVQTITGTSGYVPMVHIKHMY